MSVTEGSLPAASPSENPWVFGGCPHLTSFAVQTPCNLPTCYTSESLKIREFAFRKFPIAECRALAVSPAPYRGEPILSYSRACRSSSCGRKGRGEKQERMGSSLTDWGGCGFEAGGEPHRFLWGKAESSGMVWPTAQLKPGPKGAGKDMTTWANGWGMRQPNISESGFLSVVAVKDAFAAGLGAVRC